MSEIKGTTTLNSSVVQKVAVIAARDVEGVYHLGKASLFGSSQESVHEMS